MLHPARLQQVVNFAIVVFEAPKKSLAARTSAYTQRYATLRAVLRRTLANMTLLISQIYSSCVARASPVMNIDDSSKLVPVLQAPGCPGGRHLSPLQFNKLLLAWSPCWSPWSSSTPPSRWPLLILPSPEGPQGCTTSNIPFTRPK